MDYEKLAHETLRELMLADEDVSLSPHERLVLKKAFAATIQKAVEGERGKWDSGLTRLAAEHAEKRKEYTPEQWGWFIHNSGDFALREARDDIRALGEN